MGRNIRPVCCHEREVGERAAILYLAKNADQVSHLCSRTDDCHETGNLHSALS